jgi:hypothetical protein
VPTGFEGIADSGFKIKHVSMTLHCARKRLFVLHITAKAHILL